MKVCVVCKSDLKDKKWFHSHRKVGGSKTLLSELRRANSISETVRSGLVCEFCAETVEGHVEKESERLILETSKVEEKINAKWNITPCEHCKLNRGKFSGCASCLQGVPSYRFEMSDSSGAEELGFALYTHGMVWKKKGHVCIACILALETVVERKMFVCEAGGAEEQLIRAFREIQIKRRKKEEEKDFERFFGRKPAPI